jgi:hypothetical protein
MTNPMIRIHNANTGEVIDREMTEAEYKVHEKSVAEMQAKVAAKEAKEATKNALLERLGITAEEATLLLK